MSALTLGASDYIEWLSFPGWLYRAMGPLNAATAQVLPAVVAHEIVAVASKASPCFPSFVETPATQQPHCNGGRSNPCEHLQDDARFLLHRLENLADNHEHNETNQHNRATHLHSILQAGGYAWHIMNRCGHSWISFQRLGLEADSGYGKI